MSNQSSFKEDSISNPSLPSLRAKLFKLISSNNIKASNLLDIGCGNGSLTVEIAKLVGANKIYGVDLSTEALEASTRRGIITNSINLNRDKLPFPDNHFDLIISLEVIEHLVNTDSFLDETWRVLKGGGYFILSTPNMCSYFNRVLLMFGYMPIYYELSQRWRVGKPIKNRTRFNPVGHINLYNLRAIIDHMELTGFNIVHKYGVPIYREMIQKKLIKSVDDFFAHFPSLASGLVVLAKKESGCDSK